MRKLQSLAAWCIGGRRSTVSLLALAAGSLLVSGPAQAQQQNGNAPLTTTIMETQKDGSMVPKSLMSINANNRHGFNLFAQEDLAGTSLRLTGLYRYPLINAGGLCPFANTAGDIFNTSCGQFNGSSNFFHVTPVWGIGQSDYAKILTAFPGVATMRAPLGFSTPWRITSIAPLVIRINSADGQFGQLFSGTTSLVGGGCRDFSNAASGAGLPANFTLLASSDCPDTWPGTGFAGLRELPDSVWLQRFQADPVNFRWDDYKIPATAFGLNPIGNDEAYGAFSDYPREIVQLYGSVTPLGDQGQPPGERGFPLGLYVRADAFKFDRPSLRDGVFIRWLVINNSAKVWGKGIDYDRIFMGVDPGYIPVGQAPAAYNLIKAGAHVMSGGGMSGKCGGAFPKQQAPGATEGCVGTQNQAPSIIMFLKSPLGDLRNKMFSDPTSQFYSPTNPAAGDTITFNQWRHGGFGAQDNFSWRRSDRALFGLISGDEQLWLDGRQATDFSATQIWRYFRYEFTDGTQSAANLKFNRSVPGDITGYGKWDYNHDGIQDTIKVPDCGSLGCAGLWGDSIAGGFSNQNAGNIGNFLGVGPFALKAGDTTEFVFYMGGALDTLNTNRRIAAATSAYFKNYAGASAYPVPTFTSNDVQLNSAWFRDSTNASNTTTTLTTEIRIQVKMPPKKNDPFLQTVVDRLNQNEPVANNLRALNPNLVATVRGRMAQNLAQVLVFKSCDAGQSWTSDANCTSATSRFQTRDQTGSSTGLGWVPAFTFNADSVTGVLNSYIVSDLVQAGRTYLYSFVTKTRSLSDIKVITALPTATTNAVTSDLNLMLGFDIDTLLSSLRTSGPTTVNAYAPISVPAGTIYARLDTSRTQQLGVTNRVTLNARNAQISGVFRMRFGNRFIVTRTFDTLSSLKTTSIVRQSLYASVANQPTDAAPITNFVAAADTFVANHDFSFSSAGTLRATPRFTTGSVQTFIDTLAVAGYLIGKGTGGSDPYYLAVSNNQSFSPVSNNNGITQATSGFEGDPWFPGFTVTVNSETASPNTRSFGNGTTNFASLVLRSPTDSLNSGVVTANGVVYQNVATGGSGSSTAAVTLGLRNSLGGFYQVLWQGDSFGPGAPFRLDVNAAMQPVWNASLAARSIASYTDTSATYRTQLVASSATDGSLAATRPLVRAKLPFTVLGVNGQPAKVVMLQRNLVGNIPDSLLKNSRLLGTTGDTTRLSVPADLWLPGDTLYVFENITTDSTATVGGVANVKIVKDTVVAGRHQTLPIQVVREQLGIKVVLSCAAGGSPTRSTCNPIALGTRGATAYLPYQNGWNYKFLLNRLFDQNAEVQLNASPIQASALPLTGKDMDQIHVVPSPFVVQSQYDQIASTRVSQNFVRFVNVPNEGMVRIYSVSGQLMQQISWTASDLVASGNNSPHGDLPYNLRTREGLDLGSGLYVYVLTARGPNANGKVARGKFVVIR